MLGRGPMSGSGGGGLGGVPGTGGGAWGTGGGAWGTHPCSGVGGAFGRRVVRAGGAGVSSQMNQNRTNYGPINEAFLREKDDVLQVNHESVPVNDVIHDIAESCMEGFGLENDPGHQVIFSEDSIPSTPDKAGLKLDSNTVEGKEVVDAVNTETLEVQDEKSIISEGGANASKRVNCRPTSSLTEEVCLLSSSRGKQSGMELRLDTFI
nr:uncharacterized protein LOC110782607 isoform X1 [Spinacia oleracea]